MTTYNAAQKALLATLPKKVHDPRGVTVKMIMQEMGWGTAHAGRYLQDKIDRGEALACWYKDGTRWVKAMRIKSS